MKEKKINGYKMTELGETPVDWKAYIIINYEL
jgi:hypothetical protein